MSVASQVDGQDLDHAVRVALRLLNLVLLLDQPVRSTLLQGNRAEGLAEGRVRPALATR